MNRFFVGLVLSLGLAASVTWAENASAPVVGEGYGARVVIESGVDLTGIDRSYLQEPDIKDLRPPKNPGIVYPVWHPDGKHIVFTDHQDIYMVSTGGGQPRLVFDNAYIHESDGKRYVLNQSIIGITGFSPDGEKLYFTRNRINSSVISITEGGAGFSIAGGDITLECLDIPTGQVAETAVHAVGIAISRDGKYLLYSDRSDQTQPVMVKDLGSGDQWKVLTGDVGGASFTAEGKYIVFAGRMSDLSYQLFRVPVAGGEPEQLTASSEGPNGWRCLYPDCAPSPDWVLYTDMSQETHDYSYDYGSGRRSGSWRTVSVRALDLQSGTVYDLLPSSEHINTTLGRFSPDGKKFCYLADDYMAPSNEEEVGLYVQDISLPASNPDPQTSAADAVPTGFALTGNYPNPFNPSTHIVFSLPASGPVHLRVYDVTGRVVRNLLSAPLSAGSHEMVWDGRDDSGMTVSSGTYLARLKMGNSTAWHRMQMVK